MDQSKNLKSNSLQDEGCYMNLAGDTGKSCENSCFFAVSVMHEVNDKCSLHLIWTQK